MKGNIKNPPDSNMTPLKNSEYEGKRKEPPRFEHDSAKKIRTKDDNT